MELEIEFQFLQESIRTFPFFTKISIVAFGNFSAIFHWRRYNILNNKEIKLKTDRRFRSPVSMNDGINRAKTFWPENRSHRELESSTAGIERYGGFRQQTVWTGFSPVILLTSVIVHGVDTFSRSNSLFLHSFSPIFYGRRRSGRRNDTFNNKMKLLFSFLIPLFETFL